MALSSNFPLTAQKNYRSPPQKKPQKLPSLTFFTLLNIFLSPFFFQKLILFLFNDLLGFPNKYKVAFNLVPFERDFYVRGFLLNPFIKLLLQCLIKILLPPPSDTLSDEAFSFCKGSPWKQKWKHEMKIVATSDACPDDSLLGSASYSSHQDNQQEQQYQSPSNPCLEN